MHIQMSTVLTFLYCDTVIASTAVVVNPEGIDNQRTDR